ncbi:MAG: M48 family metallopeptidase [Vicinamibacterales bacterium]
MANEDKAARYHRLRRQAELAGTAAAAVVLILLLLSGAHLALRDVARAAGGDVVGAALVAGALLVVLGLVELPFAWYQGFTLEHRYGLSTQSPARWLGDHLKGSALGLVFGAAAAAVVYAAIARLGAWWWLGAAAVFGAAMVGLAQLAPVLLLPLFYAFKPLERPELVARLVRLASRAGARIAGVFEWTLSSHTTKANAALTGIGRTRRILLSDTLLADYSDDEIEVVLAHELAHHVHHDIWRGVALQLVLIAAGFFVTSLALEAAAGALGLDGVGDPAGVPFLALVAGTWSFLALPVANAASRAHERRADRFALETTGNAQAFVSAMRRLSQQNLAEEYPSALVQWLFYSHPPIRERIDAARRWAGGAVAQRPR